MKKASGMANAGRLQHLGAENGHCFALPQTKSHSEISIPFLLQFAEIKSHRFSLLA